MSYYSICPDCEATLDPGEACDCQLDYEEDKYHEDDTQKNPHPELQRV